MRNLLNTLKKLSMFTEWRDFSFFSLDEKLDRNNRYWVKQSLPEVLELTDQLFAENKYLEVYEILNRHRFAQNAAVQWRIGRVLFKMSANEDVSRCVRREMIQEAYEIMQTSAQLESQDANVCKWTAIVTHAWSHLQGFATRVKLFPAIKEWLVRAVALNAEDAATLYLLGKFCYNISSLNEFQRHLIEYFIVPLPECSYEEAYQYFLRAEEVQPRFYIPNLYMLGCTSLYMKQYFRARYYLKLAAHLPPRSVYEEQCSKSAMEMASDLEAYDITRSALLFENMLDSL